MLPAVAPAPAPALPGPELAFLVAFWGAWQALAARGEAAVRARHGLDLRSLIALAYVQAAPSGPARLARELGVPGYEVSRVLTALEARGAVTRAQAGPDGRRVTVTVTPAGRELWAGALATVQAVTGPPLAALGPELPRLTLALDTIAHTARQEPTHDDRPDD